MISWVLHREGNHNLLGSVDGRESWYSERCICGILMMLKKVQPYVLFQIFMSIYGLWYLIHWVRNVFSNKEYFCFRDQFDWDTVFFVWQCSQCWDECTIPFGLRVPLLCIYGLNSRVIVMLKYAWSWHVYGWVECCPIEAICFS